MRILVAEDEKNLNRLIVSRLTEEHYSVDACFDGGEAMAYLESAEYDAVVLDIMMPVMDGLAVLKKMRAKGMSTPVLLKNFWPASGYCCESRGRLPTASAG
mgnify:CR=1 FL=1